MREAAPLIARVADHCFWLGRYIERAEATARLLHTTRVLSLDGELTASQCWRPVVIVSGEQAAFTARFGAQALDAATDGEQVQRYLVWDERTLACLNQSVRGARENARSIRDVLSLEPWEVLNELYLDLLGDEARAAFDEDRDGFYQKVRRQTQLFLGLLRSTMLHDTALDFIWLGVLLERVGQTARLLDVHHHALTAAATSIETDEGLWLALLRACSGLEPYLKRHRGRVDGARIAAFLLLDPQFPRSVRYCVSSAYGRLCTIRPPDEPHLPGGQTLARLGRLETWIAREAPGALEGGRTHEALTHVVDETAEVCLSLGRELMAEPPPSATGQGQ